MDFTDRTTASDAEFEARIAPFELADLPAPLRERLARGYRVIGDGLDYRAPTPTSLRPVGSGGRRRDPTSEEGQR